MLFVERSSLEGTFLKPDPRFKISDSDFRVKIEKRLQARAQLFFDGFFTALEHMHCDVSFVAVCQLHGSLPDFHYILRRQQPHAVNQCQICHKKILSLSRRSCEILCGARFFDASHLEFRRAQDSGFYSLDCSFCAVGPAADGGARSARHSALDATAGEGEHA